MTDDPPEEPKRRWRHKLTGGSDDVRALGERVLKKNVRSESSRRWIERQINDPYVARAQLKAARALGFQADRTRRQVSPDQARYAHR